MISRRTRTFLIVNADDLNLTEGVSRGILKAHDEGIVTSTTAFSNLPVSPRLLRELRRRPALGVGIHLNVTLGNPLMPSKWVPSLVDWRGNFRRKHDFSAVSRVELLLEYERQIEHFNDVFGRLPTHLDTHHHLHDHPAVFEIVKQLAFRYRLPMRLSKCFGRAEKKLFARAGIPCTGLLMKDLSARTAWNRRSLLRALGKMGKVSCEFMCHPADCDEELVAISSFNKERGGELEAFCSKDVREFLEKKNVRLGNFSDLRPG